MFDAAGPAIDRLDPACRPDATNDWFLLNKRHFIPAQDV